MTREEAKDYIREWCPYDRQKEIIKALEQEPSEDEYIKIPKKALKYRTAGMVAYNAEWLKKHFDLERAVICGEQEPCEDAQVVTALKKLPSVNPQKPICPSEGVDPAYEKMLNKWIGAEVLDRIRNEMHATAEKHEDGVYYLRDEWVDEIIDKYAEGSDKE